MMNRIMGILILAIAVLACQDDRVVQTPSGYELDFHVKTGGKKPVEKQYVYYRYDFTVDDELRESIPDTMPDKKRMIPSKISNITSPMSRVITEALVLMTEGDSATLIIPHSEENERYMQLMPGQTARYTLKVNHIKDEAEYLKDMEEEHRKEMEKRDKRIEKADAVKMELKGYIADYNAGKLRGKLKKVSEGVEFYMLEEGSGDIPKTGDNVSVDYYGCLMDGTAFDSSMPRGVPYVFAVNKRKVIPGWDTALLNMKEGDKVIAFLSSDMAYGPGGAPPTIPPNAALAFYMHFRNIEK